MKPPSRPRDSGRTPRLWRDERAAQLAEFAIALPLLVFFVVGIFDFSGAFTLKQKLTNVARDAARVAAGDPANDLSSAAAPVSVVDAFQLIQGYFTANNLNLCGITAISGPSAALTWTASGTSNGCPSLGLTITINRGYVMPATTGASLPPVTCTSPGSGGSSGLTVIATCVSIQYAYPWRFGRVANLLGMTDTLPAQISATAVAFNEN
jgi:Flp pilus assembly protein TadG